MKKLTIWGVLILALSVFSRNAVAQETQCDFLKADGITKGLYGFCMAYCEAHEGPADIVDLTEEQAKALDPASLTLFNLFEKKAGVEGPELPCVNYAETCPVWTQEELDRIGTFGGSILYDYEESSGTIENYYDYEKGSGFLHFAQVIEYPDYYVGRYYSNNTGYPNANGVMELTADEYESCKRMLIDHQAQP